MTDQQQQQPVSADMPPIPPLKEIPVTLDVTDVRPGVPIAYPDDFDRPARPCPGYVPTGHVCERCGAAPSEHRHDRD